MLKVSNFFSTEKKFFGRIAACKFVEGIFILLGAKFLVEFIDAPSEKFLVMTNIFACAG